MNQGAQFLLTAFLNGTWKIHPYLTENGEKIRIFSEA
jgi:hypothetical protein